MEVVDLQPDEPAAAAAALKGGAHEPAEARRAGIERAGAPSEVAQARSTAPLNAFALCQASSLGTLPSRKAWFSAALIVVRT